MIYIGQRHSGDNTVFINEQWNRQPEQQHMQQEVDPTTGGLVPPATPPDPEAFETGVEETLPPGSTVTVPDPPPPPSNGQVERTFTAQDMTNARREEKDKLYGEIESTKERLARLEEEREEERKRAQAEADKIAAEAEAARVAELSAIERAEEVERRLNERIEQIESERAQERALADREQEFLRLQQYIGEQRNMHQEDIVPELLDLIAGGTKEEVDYSVSTLVERSASILANITAAQGAPAPAAPPRGASVTAPPVGPADTQSDQRTFTADEIAAMPMNEYAKYRERLLHSNSRTVQERGLYS